MARRVTHRSCPEARITGRVGEGTLSGGAIKMGVFPESGEYSAQWWATLFGCEPKTVSDGISAKGIPHRIYFGREKWVEAEEMRKAFPKLFAGETLVTR